MFNTVESPHEQAAHPENRSKLDEPQPSFTIYEFPHTPHEQTTHDRRADDYNQAANYLLSLAESKQDLIHEDHDMRNKEKCSQLIEMQIFSQKCGQTRFFTHNDA
jgi:hypothetical protein